MAKAKTVKAEAAPVASESDIAAEAAPIDAAELVHAEQQRCIDLVQMVAARSEQYAGGLSMTAAARAMVELIEGGYTPQDAPTFDERHPD